MEVAFPNGDSVILLGDFNAKLGNGIVNQDPHAISKSGKMLFSLFQKYYLCLLNSSDICQGTFTRIYQCNKRIETSVLDYVLSRMIYSSMWSLWSLMNRNNLHLGASLTPTRGFWIIVHCAIWFQVNNTIFTKEHHIKRIEVWNFNDPKGDVIKFNRKKIKDLIFPIKMKYENMRVPELKSLARDRGLRIILG